MYKFIDRVPQTTLRHYDIGLEMTGSHCRGGGEELGRGLEFDIGGGWHGIHGLW